MANTLTNLIPSLYQALDVVSREMVGFIPAVSMDTGVERAAVGQTVYSFVAPASVATDMTPAVTPPNDGDQSIGSVPLVITKTRRVPIRWNGEDTRGVNANGPGFNSIKINQLAQSIRTLVNEMETDLAGLYVGASRASGTATTTPFASTLTDPAQCLKILKDNGAPTNELQLVIDSTAGANMRTLTQLTNVNQSADVSMLRQGTLLDLMGFQVRESAQVARPAAGSMSGGSSTAAALTVGQTVIPMLNATGTGTVAAGDIITFANDTNKYVVAAASFAGANPATGDTITLAAPGIRLAQGAAARVITVAAVSARNMAFARTALVLATRFPALPEEGDMAAFRMPLEDPRSGLSFELSVYKQYRQVQYELSVSWGVKNVKPEHSVILLGE